MPNLKIFINKDYIKANGEAAVYVVVHLDYKRLRFNTGVSCNPENWNFKDNKVKGNSKRAKDDNLIIKNCVSRIHDILVRYRLNDIELTPELLKAEWDNPARRIDFFTFMEQEIEERKDEISEGTYGLHMAVVRVFREYREQITFAELTPEMLEKLQKWLRSGKRKNSTITINSKMQIMKTYLNIAVRRQIIQKNPFDFIRIKNSSAERAYLTDHELKDLWKLYKTNTLTEEQQHSIRHFLFACFTGIRYSDMLELTSNNISHQTLYYNVKKTKYAKKGLVTVPLNKYARQLIVDEKSHTNKLFNLRHTSNLNKHIRNVCKKIGVFRNLSFHGGRHTFATLWLEKTNDVAKLQKLLGHSNIAETMIYVHISDSGLQSQMINFEKSIMC